MSLHSNDEAIFDRLKREQIKERQLKARTLIHPYPNGYGLWELHSAPRSILINHFRPIGRRECEKEEKGVWRMPRLSQAMKDVTSCDKPRGGANGP